MIVLEEIEVTLPSAAGADNVLRGVSLRLRAGETASLIGPSGSGKPTLLMTAGGLVRRSAGRIEVAGSDLSSLDEDELARFRRDAVGIVFQGFHLVATMTALENVALPLEFARRREAFEIAAESLAAVRL